MDKQTEHAATDHPNDNMLVPIPTLITPIYDGGLDAPLAGVRVAFAFLDTAPKSTLIERQINEVTVTIRKPGTLEDLILECKQAIAQAGRALVAGTEYSIGNDGAVVSHGN